MRKSKIDARELITSNDYVTSQKENVIKENIIMNPDNMKIDRKNKQYYNMELDIDASIKNLVTLTI